MSIKDEIKSIIVKAGWTMSDIIKTSNEKYGRNDTVQNLSNKLSRETLKYKEAKEIADVMGYELQWAPKKNE